MSLVKHRSILTKILKDDRISPNRRLLGEMLHLWLDAETVEDKQQLMSLIQATYGSPKRTTWKDGECSDIETSFSKAEADAQESLKKFFAEAQKDSEGLLNEVSTGDVHPPGGEQS